MIRRSVCLQGKVLEGVVKEGIGPQSPEISLIRFSPFQYADNSYNFEDLMIAAGIGKLIAFLRRILRSA
jgi:hypothetical protein